MSGHERQMQFLNAIEHPHCPTAYGPLHKSGSNRGNVRTIAEMVERALLPELSQFERAENPNTRQRGTPQQNLGNREIDAFVDLLLDGNPGRGFAQLQDLQAGGVELESIYLELLAPVARQLGPMWLSDELSFSEISIALIHLQSIVSKLARSSNLMFVAPDPDRHLVLARAQGEQHTFGLLIAGELFSRSGWQISGGIELETGPALNELLASDWITVLGLTAGSRRQALGLRKPIEEARRYSINPDLVVMVGGAAFLAEPDLLAEIGGDLIAGEGHAAIASAEQLIA